MPRFPRDAAWSAGRAPIAANDAPSVWYVRIVVLTNDDDGWCVTCGLPSATTVTYVLEQAGHRPTGLCRLTYCEACEGA